MKTDYANFIHDVTNAKNIDSIVNKNELNKKMDEANNKIKEINTKIMTLDGKISGLCNERHILDNQRTALLRSINWIGA